MADRDHHRPTADRLTILTQGMRRMGSLRLEDIAKGFENFAVPSAKGMLESMGRTRDDRVATMVEMLRNSPEADIAEMSEVFGLAMARLAEERSRDAAGAAGAARRSGRREMSAAQWRRQRRLVS